MKENIKVLVVEPLKKAYETVIPNTLEAMQQIVGGRIKAVSLDENTVAVMNEEGKFNKFPNRPLFINGQECKDVIGGTFFLVGSGEEDFTDIEQKSLVKYQKLYGDPVILKNIEGELEIKKRLDLMTYSIWMLKQTATNRPYFFEALDVLKKIGLSPERNRYEKVYTGAIIPDENRFFVPKDYLERLYVKFNIEKPDNYNGRSLSVSDIIVFSDVDRNEKAYFCDHFGFKEIPEFLE